MKFENYIVKTVPINISDTYSDLSVSNRVLTRDKLVFTGSSIFDIQFLYPLFSELTYPTSAFKGQSTYTY